jgi:hypothetical protein
MNAKNPWWNLLGGEQVEVCLRRLEHVYASRAANDAVGQDSRE